MSIEVDLKRVLSLAIGAMLGYGPEPEIAQVALDTIEMAGFRVVPVVDDATRQEVQRLVGRLTEISVPSSDADAVIQLGRIQPEPFKSQMVGVARSLTEAQQLTARAAELLDAAYLGSNNGTTRG